MDEANSSNLQLGYGYNRLQPKYKTTDPATGQEQEVKQSLNYQAIDLMGELNLSINHAERAVRRPLGEIEEEVLYEKRNGVNFVKVQGELSSGLGDASSDRYQRYSLDLGVMFFSDTESKIDNDACLAYTYGITGRFEHTSLGLSDNKTISGDTWQVVVPLGFALGKRKFRVADRLEMAVEFTPSFKLRNSGDVSYRAYNSYGKKAIQSVDIYLNDVYQFGPIGGGADIRGHFISGGVRLGF